MQRYVLPRPEILVTVILVLAWVVIALKQDSNGANEIEVPGSASMSGGTSDSKYTFWGILQDGKTPLFFFSSERITGGGSGSLSTAGESFHFKVTDSIIAIKPVVYENHVAKCFDLNKSNMFMITIDGNVVSSDRKMSWKDMLAFGTLLSKKESPLWITEALSKYDDPFQTPEFSFKWNCKKTGQLILGAYKKSELPFSFKCTSCPDTHLLTNQFFD